MKKILIAVITSLILLNSAGCNYQVFDTTYTFDKAILSLPDGTLVEGKVQSWKDFDDGDQIQVKINNVTYLVNSSSIVLIDD